MATHTDEVWTTTAKALKLLAMQVLRIAFALMLGTLQGTSHPGFTPDAGAVSATLSGDYKGLEKIIGYSPEERDTKWFHENTLIVRGNEAILDMVPVSVHRGKKSYSASDGGFLTYRGRFFQKEGKLFVSLRLFMSDYIIFPTNACEPYSKVEVFPVLVHDHMIEIRGVRYRSDDIDKKLLKSLLLELNQEPMQYTGERPYSQQMHAPICPAASTE